MNQIAHWSLPDELASADTAGAAELLSRYFHTTLDDGSPAYTGAMFETFAGGGDAPEVVNTFTPADLVAVSLLSVDVPGAAALRILGRDAENLNGFLERIPTDLELCDTGENEIGPGSPADKLWTSVRGCGAGPVTTSKLLARKRPRLLPVIDTVVKEVLGHPAKASFWLTLRAHLAADDGRLADRLIAIRDQAGLPNISVIRCFDVLVWMIGKRDGVGETRGRY